MRVAFIGGLMHLTYRLLLYMSFCVNEPVANLKKKLKKSFVEAVKVRPTLWLMLLANDKGLLLQFRSLAKIVNYA